MTYPQDAITKTFIVDGVIPSTFIDNPPATILSVHIQQSGLASETQLLCGPDVIAFNFAKDYGLDLIQYFCNQNLTISKTGQDKAFVSLTYIKRDISQATSTEPFVFNGYTNGEIINGVFLFLILMVLSFGLFLKMLYPKK